MVNDYLASLITGAPVLPFVLGGRICRRRGLRTAVRLYEFGDPGLETVVVDDIIVRTVGMTDTEGEQLLLPYNGYPLAVPMAAIISGTSQASL